ncbi:MAG: glycosyl transferase, partial [Sphaerospermopsis kisseleviana]
MATPYCCIEKNQNRVAFLIPSVEYGAYWLPILTEFSQYFKEVVCYTGKLPKSFNSVTPGISLFHVVGRMIKIELIQNKGGYSHDFLILSPAIIGCLIRFRPHVIFTSGFSLWTILALLLNPLGRWSVILIYDGVSPNL